MIEDTKMASKNRTARRSRRLWAAVILVLFAWLVLANPDRWFERLHMLDVNSGRTRDRWSVLLIPVWYTAPQPTWVTVHATPTNRPPRWRPTAVTTWPARRCDYILLGSDLSNAREAEIESQLYQWSPETCRAKADEFLAKWKSN